jgi:hypothetical protein
MARHMFGKMLEKAKLLLENDPEFAVKYYSRAIKSAARDHGPQSPQVLNLRQDRAVAWHKNGESEKAEAELATLIAQRELTAGTPFSRAQGMRLRCSSSGAFLKPLLNIGTSRRCGPPPSAPIILIPGGRGTG